MTDDELLKAIDLMIFDQRPVLYEEWTAAGTRSIQLRRLVEMAREIEADRNRILCSLSEEQIDSRVRELRNLGQLDVLAAAQAVWSATPADLERQRAYEAMDDEEMGLDDF